MTDVGLWRHGVGMTSARTRERLVQELRSEGIATPQVLQRLRDVPRHQFVDEALASRAYENIALPIGHGQTISQPYIVARMTEALVRDRTCRRVLEIGTGCGYQTAVLAGLVDEVYTIERIGALLQRARTTLSALGLRNVRFRHGDGFAGWPEAAPFDGIIVTAAPISVPQELLQQLEQAGRMVIPVGPTGSQVLTVFTRDGEQFKSTPLDQVSFVPLRDGKV